MYYALYCQMNFYEQEVNLNIVLIILVKISWRKSKMDYSCMVINEILNLEFITSKNAFYILILSLFSIQ